MTLVELNAMIDSVELEDNETSEESSDFNEYRSYYLEFDRRYLESRGLTDTIAPVINPTLRLKPPTND